MNVWVVGGTSGIGMACREMLFLSDQIDRVTATGAELDVTDQLELVKFLCNGIDSEVIPYDIMVYSAGRTDLEWSLDQDVNLTMTDIMHVNCFGLINVLQAMYKCATLPSRCVVIGSDAAWRPMRTSLAYCASKAALHMAVKVLAREYSESFRINCVAPGMTHGTEMQKYIDERVPEVRGWTPEEARIYEATQRVSAGRVTPKEVAEVVRWLALDAPYSVHGEIITINGGRS